MADNIIATWQDVEDKGYIVSSSDDLSQCPTKQKLLNANVKLSSEANSYSDTRLIPDSFIKTLTSLMIKGVSGYSYNAIGITINGTPITGSWSPISYGAYPSINQIEAIAYLSDRTDTSIYRTEAPQLSLFYPNDVSISNLSAHVIWHFQQGSSNWNNFKNATIRAEYLVKFEGTSKTFAGSVDSYRVYPGSLINVYIEKNFSTTMMNSRPTLISLSPNYFECECSSQSSYSLRPSVENQEENIPEPIFVKEEDGKIYYEFSDYEQTNSVEIPEILMEQEPEIHEYIDSSIGLKITVEIRHMPEYQNLET